MLTSARQKEIALAWLRRLKRLKRRMTRDQRIARAGQVMSDTLRAFIGEQADPQTLEHIRVGMNQSLERLIQDRVIADGRIVACAMEETNVVKVEWQLMPENEPGFTVLSAVLQM